MNEIREGFALLNGEEDSRINSDRRRCVTVLLTMMERWIIEGDVGGGGFSVHLRYSLGMGFGMLP